MKALRGLLALFLALSLLPSAPTMAAGIAGAKCAVPGKQRLVAGQSFTCKRVAGRLIWVKAKRLAPAPTPTPTPTPAPVAPRVLPDDATITPAAMLAAPGACRTGDRTPYGEGSEAFPRPAHALAGIGSYRILVLPFGVADYRPDPQQQQGLERALREPADFYERVSFGQLRLSFEFVAPELWPQLPGKADDYNLVNKRPQQDNTSMVQTLFAGASPKINFDLYDAVIIESAYWSVSGGGQGFPSQRFTAPTGTAKRVNLHFGNAVARSEVITHELGHSLFALEDLYIFLNSTRPSVPIPNPVYAWDVMSGEGPVERDFTAWNKYLIGWIPDARVRCVVQPLAISRHYLASSQRASQQPQLLVVQREPGVMLAIDARGRQTSDAQMQALVYFVDTRISHGDGPIASEQQLLPAGATLEAHGYRIWVVAADRDGLMVDLQQLQP